MPNYNVKLIVNIKRGHSCHVAGEMIEVNTEEYNNFRHLKLIDDDCTKGVEIKPKTIDEMSLPELINYATENNIDLGEAKKKGEVYEAIRAALNKE